jgi:benzoyl-CoA reductase/2-hydroxyglutaryl-CoA dehydratase subunit BcrC/BadD/HgdB
MNELLLLCGYEAAEMEKELPRIEKAFARLGITDEDIVRGRERVRTYYDIELSGVRQLLGMFIRELVNMVLAKDEGRTKIIHACMAGGFEAVGSAFVTFSKDVFVEVPNPPFMVVFGGIFGRFIPILEAAEELWLKSGLVGHCAMVKSRVGILSLGLIPWPDAMVTSGLLCETSPKTNDIFHRIYGIPTVFFDTCQDRETWEYPDSTRSIALEAASMRAAATELGRLVGFELKDDMVREVLLAREDYGAAVTKVHRLIREADPVPLGSTHENLLTWLTPVAMSIEGLERATTAVNTLHEELSERVGKGVGVTRKGAPKIMGILPNHHTDPRLEQLINQLGMAVVAVDYELMTPLPEGIEQTDDPYVAASQLLRGSMALPLAARVKVILEGCRRWNIDGVLDHFHVGCRGVAADALVIQEAVTRELGIPVLALEWENFDPRVFSYEQYKAKLEVFRSMMEGRRQS